MKSTLTRVIIPLVATLAAGLVWAGTIMVAAHVSTIILDTLDMIVQLAAISPDAS